MGSFVTARLDELPAWIGGAVSGEGTVDTGVELARAAGSLQDDELATLKAGIGARFLDACPDDGLDHWGRGVRIPRMPGESHDTYRARLEEAWTTWELAGTAPGIEAQLRAYGVADVEVVEDWQGQWGEGHVASHVWALLGPTMPWEPRLAPFVGGPDTLGGSTATPAEVRQAKALVLAWKAPHTYPMAIRLHFDGVVHGGPRTVAPFTPPESSPHAEWRLDKTAPLQAPFVAGGFDT